MKTFNELLSIAEKAGFKEYSNIWNEVDPMRTPEICHHSILTCTKGKYSGEVIDILYNDLGIIQIDHSTQFEGQRANFRFIGN